MPHISFLEGGKRGSLRGYSGRHGCLLAHQTSHFHVDTSASPCLRSLVKDLLTTKGYSLHKGPHRSTMWVARAWMRLYQSS